MQRILVNVWILSEINIYCTMHDWHVEMIIKMMVNIKLKCGKGKVIIWN